MKIFRNNAQPEIYDITPDEIKERRDNKVILSVAISMLLFALAKIIHIQFFS